MRSLPPSLKAAAWAYQSAAPLLNRTGAACGPSIILRAVQDSVSHYPPATRHTTQLCPKIALHLQTAFTAMTEAVLECWSTHAAGLRGWTVRLLTEEAIRRRLVPRVGRETIRVLLESHDLKPWREKNVVRGEAG